LSKALQNCLTVLLSVIIAGCLVGFGLIFYRTFGEAQWRERKHDAQQAYSKQNYDAAANKMKEAAKTAVENFGDEDPRFVDTLKRLAWIEDARGRYNVGREYFTYVYKLSPEELYKVKASQVSLAMVDSLKDLRNSGTTKGPETVLRKSSETIEKYLGSNDPELVPLLQELAMIYRKENKFGEAETQYLRIFSIMRETEGDTSAGAAYAHRLLGGLYDEWGKPEDAVKNYKDAIAMYSEVLGPTAPQIKEVQDEMDGKKPVQNAPEVYPDLDKMRVPELASL